MSKYSLSKTPQDILALTADRHRRLRKKKEIHSKSIGRAIRRFIGQPQTL
jgi:hypothetical protein